MTRDAALAALTTRVTNGTTALRDAIVKAVEMEEADPHTATTIVVVTDGLDNASQHLDNASQQFANLARKGKAAVAEERAELMRLKKLFDDADRVKRIPIMEFDAVLLNSRSAVVCESKSSMTAKELNAFHDRVDLLMLRAAKKVEFKVFQDLSVLPVLLANHFLENHEELDKRARDLGILLITRNGMEFGPRLTCSGVSDCELYRSLLRQPPV